MIVYKFDGTKNGILSCLFESFTKNERPFLVTSGAFQESFDMTVKSIKTNDKNAERVSNGLKKYGSITLLNQLFYVLRSCDGQRENVIFQVAYKCLKNRRDESYNYTDVDVLQFRDLYNKINAEQHRYLGIVRFIESENGALYSHIEPDNDIVDLIAPHFIKRLGLNFIIHDTKRNKAVISNGQKFITFYPSKPFTIYLSQDEEEIEKLWKQYYQSVNIVERKNLKQMYNYLPLRYQKSLPEKQNLKSPMFED